MIVEVADEVWGGRHSAAPPSPPSWPGLSRPSTSCLMCAMRTWMPGTRPGMTEIRSGDTCQASSQEKSPSSPARGRGIGRAIAHADGGGGRERRRLRHRRGARRLGRRHRPGAGGGRRDQEGGRQGDRLDALDRRAAERRRDRARPRSTPSAASTSWSTMPASCATDLPPHELVGLVRRHHRASPRLVQHEPRLRDAFPRAELRRLWCT